MIKTFCDCCGKEICEANNNLLLGGGLGRKGAIISPAKRRESDALKVEVIVYTNEVSNNGHYCKHCIIDALTADDDRPGATRTSTWHEGDACGWCGRTDVPVTQPRNFGYPAKSGEQP